MNNVNISCGSTMNIKQLIINHIIRISTIKYGNIFEITNLCDHGRNNKCPFQGNRLKTDIMYKASVNCEQKQAVYDSTTFKTGSSNYLKSF